MYSSYFCELFGTGACLLSYLCTRSSGTVPSPVGGAEVVGGMNGCVALVLLQGDYGWQWI